MGAVLSGNTTVNHPDTGAPTELVAGSELPDWAVDLVGDHLLGASDGPPPKSGTGSGAKAWRQYAADNEVEVAEDASRDDVIAALEAAGLATESDPDA